MARSKSLGRVSMRIEKTIIALLQTLNDDLLRHMFFTVEGERFMRRVVASHCSLQNSEKLRRQWRCSQHVPHSLPQSPYAASAVTLAARRM